MIKSNVTIPHNHDDNDIEHEDNEYWNNDGLSVSVPRHQQLTADSPHNQ